MTEHDVPARRARAVAEAMADIRRISAAGPLDRPRVEAFRERLLALLAQRELFPASDFPPPTEGRGCLYRIAEDADGRFALYVNACRDRTDSPVHNHTTWAVVCGFEGQELNRFYERQDDGGVAETHRTMVEAGTGVAMLPDDLHSIHISGGALNFHMYGLALDRLDEREYYSETDRTWKRMAAFGEIREGRPGVVVGS
jgi:predicted metal-dependent enzyme (double-stranded beta helix superfamily)